MILRIVRMEFRPDSIEAFDALFNAYSARISQAEGCLSLELHGDPGNPLVRYTHSHWEEETFLNAYRSSALFGEVWAQTKALFGARPQAFSLVCLQKFR